LPIGAIALDALFSPVTKVSYEVENMRVGDRTDYNRLKLNIETDGTILPSAALRKAASILKDHFEKIIEIGAEAKEENVGEVKEVKKEKEQKEHKDSKKEDKEKSKKKSKK
jgi:DNA-directed RNA polymerase subunit alpha